MCIKIICIEYILWRLLTTKSIFDVVNILKMSVKDLPMNDIIFNGTFQGSSLAGQMYHEKSQSLVQNCPMVPSHRNIIV